MPLALGPFNAALKAWYEREGDVMLQGYDKQMMMQVYLGCFPVGSKTQKQASRAVQVRIRSIRKIINPEKTKKKWRKKEEGDQTSKSKVVYSFLKHIPFKPFFLPFTRPT